MPELNVSIILPVYGDSPYLEDCLHSLNNQIDCELYELIIVLDRVSNTNLGLIKKFKFNLKFKIVENKNKGLANSLNLGVMNSTTEYIARIDHDDLMKSNRLRTQLNFFSNNPEYVVIGSNVTLIDKLGNLIRESSYPNTNELIKKALSKKNVVAHPSVMLRKAAVLEVGMYRSFYEGAEDYDLWMRLVKIGKIANLKESLTLYRQHSEQMSTKNMKKQWIITEAVKTSAKLKLSGAIELDSKYNSIDEWYKKNPRIRFKYKLVRFRSLVNKYIFTKYWSQIVKQK